MDLFEKIKSNVLYLKERVGGVCSSLNISEESIKIIGVTKYVGAKEIDYLIQAGINEIGENRVLDFKEKKEHIKQKAIFHMIGHLQTNKVNHCVEIFDIIQSIDSFHLAEKLDKVLQKKNKKMPVFIEFNTSKEITKYGFDTKNALEVLERITNYKNICLEGIMTIGPLKDINTKEGLREVVDSFRTLRKIFDDYNSKTKEKLKYCSMGMTDDFEIAIKEGSNMIRVGRLLFR